MTMQITLPRWLLPVSILVNMFLVGAVVALALPMLSGPLPHPPFGSRGPGGPDGPEGPGRSHGPLAMAERMADSLPPADAAILREAIAARAEAMRAADKEMRAFPDRLREALDSEPFQTDALKTVFTAGRDARVAMDDALSAAIADAAARMSADGRHSLADWRPDRPGAGRPEGPPRGPARGGCPGPGAPPPPPEPR